MIDEKSCRLPTYVEGERIRLANGQSWSFRDPAPCGEDDDHQSLLRALGEADDEPERLRGELALTILLLSRNYRLTPADYRELLEFAPDDPALAEMQGAVGALAARQRQALAPLAAAHRAVPLSPPPMGWGLTHLLRRFKHVASS